MFQEISNDTRNSLIQWVLTPAVALWKFSSIQFNLAKLI
jgi:hypothetical protein